MKLFGILLALFCAVALPAAAQHTHGHSFRGAGQWSKVFDDPSRDAWQKPHEVIGALALAPGAAVADIGAGTGYFTVRLARMLPSGRVYAVDTERDMVEHLASRARKEGLKNVVAVQGTPASPKLPAPVDLALFVNVYHHIDARERYFRDLSSSLAPRGRVAIIDFRPDAPAGPPRVARIAPERVKAELQAAGYVLEQEHAFLPYQYFLVFRPRS